MYEYYNFMRLLVCLLYIHKSIEERNNAKIDCRKEVIDSCSRVGCFDNAEYLYDDNNKSCLYTYNYSVNNMDFYVISDTESGIIYWCTADFNKNTSEESYSSNQESNNTDDCKKRYKTAKNKFSGKRETIR